MLCYHFSCIMGPPRICPHCGVVLKDRCALYTHIIDVHDRRFCLYCDHEEGKSSRMRRHIRKRHHVDVSLDEEPHRPAHVAVRPIPPAPSCVPGYTPDGDASQICYMPTPKDECPKLSRKKRHSQAACASTSVVKDCAPHKSISEDMEAPLVTLPSPPKPTLPKDDALPIASDLDTPKLPTLTPGSEDYVSDWDITADFSIEEPITVVSITPVDVADTRTVIATNGMPVPGNVERAALQLLPTMADDVAKPAPLLPPQPPSPLSPTRISKPEGEVDSPPPVSTSPPQKKMKIISLPPAPTDRSGDLTLSPVHQPLDLTVCPQYYPIPGAYPIQSPLQNPVGVVSPHYSPISEASDGQPVSGCTGTSRQNLLCTCRCHCICGACCPWQCICEGRRVSYKDTRL